MATKQKNEFNWKKVWAFFSFIALIFVGIAVLLGKAIPKISVMQDIGLAIAITVAAIYAFYFARSKRNVWFMVTWIVSVALVIIGYILQIAL